MKEEEEDTVLVSSDSEDDENQQWVKKCKNKQFRHLWDKVQPLLFHYVLPEYKSSYFPYAKFKEFSEDLRKSLALVYVESTQAFIWKNLIRWLVSMKPCYEGFSDLKYDEKYNLILTDFMAQYMNYKCNLYCTITDETEVCRRVDEILVTLGIVFSGNVPNILMTLLKIEVKDVYRLILDPIFRKYLSHKHLHDSHDLISYLRLVLCYRQWKKLAHFKEDKELINEIAVGKSEKTLKSQARSMVVDLTEQEAVLPKIVPQVNEANKSFAVISGLIGFAIRNKAYGTRILLINKSLDLEETIVKYFQQYEKYINRSDTILCESTQALRIFDDFWEDIGCPVPLPKPIVIQDFKRSSRQQNKTLSDDSSKTPTSKIRGKTEEHVQLEPQNENNIDKQGTNAVNQHLSTDCDIFKISNTLNHSNLSKINSRSSSSSSSSGSKQLSLSFKKKAQTRNSDKLNILSNKKDAVIELDSTDDDDDAVVVDDCISDKRIGSAVSYEKQTNESPKLVEAQTSYIETLKQRAVNIGNNSDSNSNLSIGLKERSNTIVLSSSSDEEDNVVSVVSVSLEKQSNSENLARGGSNSKTKPISERISRRIGPHGERPVRKEKLHCITGEVSSTTSMDCASTPDADNSRSVHVSSLENAREVGTLSAVHTSPRRGSILASTDFSDISDDEADPSSLSGRRHISRLNWSRFSKVVEEATSSTSEIPIRCTGETTPDNVIFSIHPHQLRRSTSSSPCPTRTSSPSESCLNISPSSTNRMGSTRSASRPRVTSVSRISMQRLNSLTCDDDDVATCSKYIRRPPQREELQTNQTSDRKSSSSVDSNLQISQEESVTATCSRYVSGLSSRLREKTTDTLGQSNSTNKPLESLQRSNSEVSAVEKETILLDAGKTFTSTDTPSRSGEASEEKDNLENCDDDNEDLNEFLNEMSVLIGDTEEVNIFDEKSNNKESPAEVFSSLEETEMEEYNLEVVETNEDLLSSLQNETISKNDLLKNVSSQIVEGIQPQEISPKEVGTESANLNLQTDMSKDSNESDKNTSIVLKTSTTTSSNSEEYKESEVIQSSEYFVRLIDETIGSNTTQEITSQPQEIEATKISRVEQIDKTSGAVSQLGKSEADFTHDILERMLINQTSSSHSKIQNKVISELSNVKQTLSFEDSSTEFGEEDASNDDDIESPAYEPITPEASIRDMVEQTSANLESKDDLSAYEPINPETLVCEAVDQTSASAESKEVAEKGVVVAVTSKVSLTEAAEDSRDDHLKNNSTKLILEIQTDVESSEPESHNESNASAYETKVSQNEVLKEVIASSSLVEPSFLSPDIPSQVFEEVNSLDFPEYSNDNIVSEVNSIDNEHSSEGNSKVAARIPRETDHAYVSKVFEPKQISQNVIPEQEAHCTDTKVVLSENQIENISTEFSKSSQNFVMTNKSSSKEHHHKEYDEAPEIEVSAEEISDDQIFQDYITEGETSEDENYKESTPEVDKFPIKISQKKKLEVDNKKAGHNILKFEVNEIKNQPPVEDGDKTQVLSTTFAKEYRCLIAHEMKEGISNTGNDTINTESKTSENLEFECTENETTQIKKITSKDQLEQAPKDDDKTQVSVTDFVKQNQCLIKEDMISKKENESVHVLSVDESSLKVKVKESIPEIQSTIFKDQPGPKEDDKIQVLATHFGKQNQRLIDGEVGNRKDDEAVYAVNIDDDLLKVKINESTANQSIISKDQPQQAPKDDDKTHVLVENEADELINSVRVDKSELGIEANDTVSQIQCGISKDKSIVKQQARSDEDKIQVVVTHVEIKNQSLFNSEVRTKKPYIENKNVVKIDKKHVHSASADESVNETTPQSQIKIKISNDQHLADKQDITVEEKAPDMQFNEENPNQYTKDESIVAKKKGIENTLPIVRESANKNESCAVDVAETQCEQTVPSEVEKPSLDSLKNKDTCECIETNVDENLGEHADVRTSVEALNDTQIEVEEVDRKVLKTASVDMMQLPAENSQKEKNNAIELSDNLFTIEENKNFSTPKATEPNDKVESKECRQIVTKSIENPLTINITDKHKFSINRKLKIRIASMSGELKKYLEKSKISSQEPEKKSVITPEAKPIEESQLEHSKDVKEISLESKPVKSEKKISELQANQETQSPVAVINKNDQLDNEILKKSNEQNNSRTDSAIYTNKEKTIAEEEFIEVDNLKVKNTSKTENNQFSNKPPTQIGDASKLCNDMSTIDKQIIDQSDTSATLQTTETVATEETEEKKPEELTKDTTQVDRVVLGPRDEYPVNQCKESAKPEDVPLEDKTDASKITGKVDTFNKKSSSKSQIISTPLRPEEKLLTEVWNNEPSAEKKTEEVLTTDEASIRINDVLIKSKDTAEKVCVLTGESIALQSLINMSPLESHEIRQNETILSNLIISEKSESLLKIQDTEFKTNDVLKTINKSEKLSVPMETFPQEISDEKITSDGMVANEIIKSESNLPESNSKVHDILKSTKIKSTISTISTISTMTQETVEKKKATPDCLIGNEIIKSVPAIPEAKSKAHKILECFSPIIKDELALLLVEENSATKVPMSEVKTQNERPTQRVIPKKTISKASAEYSVCALSAKRQNQLECVNLSSQSQSWSTEAEAPILLNLRRTEIVPTEDDSNLSTQVQVGAGDLDDPLTSFGSESAGSPYQDYTFESDSSPKASQSIEDQEVSKITSQESTTLTYHTYHDDCGTPVLDEKDAEDVDTPSTHGKIISLSILKEIPKLPDIPCNPIAFSNQYPSNTPSITEDQNHTSSPAIIRPQINSGLELPTPNPLTESLASVSSNTNESNSKKMFVSVSQFIEPSPKPKRTSESDSEYQRTPLKMRLKRRISQCADINEEFNLGSIEVTKCIEMPKVQTLEASTEQITYPVENVQPIPNYNVPLNLVIRDDKQVSGLNEKAIPPPKKIKKFEISPEKEEEDQNLRYQESWFKKLGISKTNHKTLSQELHSPDFHATRGNQNSKTTLTERNAAFVIEQKVSKVSNQEGTNQEEAIKIPHDETLMITKNEGRRKKPRRVKKLTEPPIALPEDISPDCRHLLSTITKMETPSEPSTPYQTHVREFCTNFTKLSMDAIMPLKQTPLIETAYNPEDIKAATILSNMLKKSNKVDDTLKIEPEKPRKSRKQKKTNQNTSQCVRLTRSTSQRIDNLPLVTPSVISPKPTSKKACKKREYNLTESIWQHEKTQEILRSLNTDTHAALESNSFTMTGINTANAPSENVSDSDDAGKLIIDLENRSSRITKGKGRGKTPKNNFRVGNRGTEALEKKVNELLRKANKKAEMEEDISPPTVEYNESMLLSPVNVFKLTPEVDVFFADANVPKSSDNRMDPMLQRKSTDDDVAAFYPIIQLTEHFSITPKTTRRGRKSSSKTGRRIIDMNNKEATEVLTAESIGFKPSTKLKSNKKNKKIEQTNNKVEEQSKITPIKALDSNVQPNNTVSNHELKPKPIQKIKQRLSFSIDSILGNETESCQSFEKESPSKSENVNANKSNQSADITMNKELWLTSFSLRKNSKSLDEVVKGLIEARPKVSPSSSNPSIKKAASSTSLSHQSEPVETLQIDKKKNRRKSLIKIKMKQPSTIKSENVENTIVSPIETGIMPETSTEKPIVNTGTDIKSGVLDTSRSSGTPMVKEETLEAFAHTSSETLNLDLKSPQPLSTIYKVESDKPMETVQNQIPKIVSQTSAKSKDEEESVTLKGTKSITKNITELKVTLQLSALANNTFVEKVSEDSKIVPSAEKAKSSEESPQQLQDQQLKLKKFTKQENLKGVDTLNRKEARKDTKKRTKKLPTKNEIKYTTESPISEAIKLPECTHKNRRSTSNPKSKSEDKSECTGSNKNLEYVKIKEEVLDDEARTECSASEIESVQVVSENIDDLQSLKPITTPAGDETIECIATIDSPKNALNTDTKNLQSSDSLEALEKVQIKLENTSELDEVTKTGKLKPIENIAEEINSSCVASEMVMTSANHQYQNEKPVGITESLEAAHHRSEGTDFKEIAEQRQAIEDCKSSGSSPKEFSMTTNKSLQIEESLEKSQTEVQQILKSTSSQETKSEPKGVLEHMNSLNESELRALGISKSDSTLLSTMSLEVSEEGLQHTTGSEISKVIHLEVSESKSKLKSKKKQKNEKFMKKSQNKLKNTQNSKLTTKSVSFSERESVADALEVEKSLKLVETVQFEEDGQTTSKSGLEAEIRITTLSKPEKEAETARNSIPERKKSKKAKKKIKNTSKSEALPETESKNKLKTGKSAEVDQTQFEQKPDDKVTTKSTVISNNEILNAVVAPTTITDASDSGASAKFESGKESVSLDCTQISDPESTPKVAMLEQDKSPRNDLKHTESLQAPFEEISEENLQSSNVVKHIEEERQVEEETKPTDGVLDHRKAFHSNEIFGTADSKSHFEAFNSEGVMKSTDLNQKMHLDDVVKTIQIHSRSRHQPVQTSESELIIGSEHTEHLDDVKTVQIDSRSRHQPEQTSESELITESEHSVQIISTVDASKLAEDSFKHQHSLEKNATLTDTKTDIQSDETLNDSEEIYHPQTKIEPTPTAILPESETEPEQIIKNIGLIDNENVDRAPEIDEQQSEKTFEDLEKPIESKCVEISQDTELTETSKKVLNIPESKQQPETCIAEPVNIAVSVICKPGDLDSNIPAKVEPELCERSADQQPKVILPSEVDVITESKVDSQEIVTEVEVTNEKPSEHKEKPVELAEIHKETPKPTEKERTISKKPSKISKRSRNKFAKRSKRTIKSLKSRISPIEQIVTDQVTEAGTLPTEKIHIIDSVPKIECTALQVNDVEAKTNDALHHCSVEEMNGGILQSEIVDTGTDSADNAINKSLIEEEKVEALKIDNATAEPDEVTADDSDLSEKTEVTLHQFEAQVVDQTPESEKVDESSEEMKSQELTSVEMIEKTNKIITPPEKSTLNDVVAPEKQISTFSPEESYTVEEDLSSIPPKKALESIEITEQETNCTAQQIVDLVSKDTTLEVNVLKENVPNPQSPIETVQNLTCVSKPSDRNLVEKLDTTIITRKKVVVLVKKLNLHTIQEKSQPNLITTVASTTISKAKELKWTEFWKGCDNTSKSQGKRKRLSLDCSNINASSLTGTLLNRSQSMESGLVLKPEIPLTKRQCTEVILKSIETLKEKDESQYSEKSEAIQTPLVSIVPTVSTSSNDSVASAGSLVSEISEDKSSTSSEVSRNHTGPQEVIPSIVSIIAPTISARESETEPIHCISPTSTSPSISPISSTSFSSSASSLSATTEISPMSLIPEALPVTSSFSTPHTCPLSPTTTISLTDSVPSTTSICTVLLTSSIAPISPITSSPSTSSLLISPTTSTVSSIPLTTTGSSELTSIQIESEVKDDVQVRVKTDIQIEQKNEVQKVEEQLEMSIENILGNQLSKKDKNQPSTGISKIIVTNRPHGFDSVPEDIFAGSGDTCDNIESKFYPTLLKPEDLLLNNTYIKDNNQTGNSDSQKKSLEFVCATNTECSKEASAEPTNSEEDNDNESENPEGLVDTSTSEGNSASEIELDPFVMTNIADIHTIGNSPIFEENCIVQSECLSDVVEKVMIEPNPFQPSDCMISGNDRHKFESDLTFLFGPPLLVLEPEIDTMPTVSPFDIQRKSPKHITLPDVELDFENELFPYTVANFDPKPSRVNELGSTNGKQLSNTLAANDVTPQSTVNYYAPAVEVSTDVGFESYDELLANNNPFFSASDLEKSKQNVTEQEMRAPPSPIIVNGLKSTESELDILTPQAHESSLNGEMVISNPKDMCPEANRVSNLITATTISEKESVASDTSKKRNKDYAKDIPENKEIVDRPKYKKEKLVIPLPPKEEAISSPVKLKSHPTPFWKRKSIRPASPKRDPVELKAPLPNADVEKSPNPIEVKKSKLPSEANIENISKSSDDKLDIPVEPVKESPVLITEVITIPIDATVLTVSTDTLDEVRSKDTLAKLPELDEVALEENKQQNKLPSEESNKENSLDESETNPNKLEKIELSQDRSSLPQPAVESVVQIETQDSDISSCEPPNKKPRIEEVINSLGEDKSPVEPLTIKPTVQTDTELSNIELVSTREEHPTKMSKIGLELDNEYISDEPRTKKPRPDSPVKLECNLLYDEPATKKPKAEAVARLSTDDLFDRLKRESPVNVLMRKPKTTLQNASFEVDDNCSSDSDLIPLASHSLPITSVDESEPLSVVPSLSPSASSSSPISTPSMPIILTPSILEKSPIPKQIPSPVEPVIDKPKIVIEKDSALPKPVSSKPLLSKEVSSKKVSPATPTAVNPPSSAKIQADTIGKSIKIAKKRTRWDKDVNKSKETSPLPPNPHPKSCRTPPVNNPIKPSTPKASPAEPPLPSSSSKVEPKLSNCRVTFSPLVTKIPEITPVLGRRMSTSSNSSFEQSSQPTKPVKSILISPSKCFSSKPDTVHSSQTKILHSMPPPIKPSPLLKVDIDSPSSSQKSRKPLPVSHKSASSLKPELASPSQSPKVAKHATTPTSTTVSHKNTPPIKPPTHSKRPSSTQSAYSTTPKHSAGFTIMVASLTAEIESLSESIKQLPKIDETYSQHKKRKNLVETLEQKRKQLEELEKQHRYEIRQSQILFPKSRPHSEHQPFENHYRSVVHSSQREPKDRQKESRHNYVNKFGELRNRSFVIPDKTDIKTAKESKTLPSWEPKHATTEEIIADLKLKTSRRY